MSDLYTRLCDRVTSLRDAGVDPDRIVVPTEHWAGVRDQATVNEGEGVLGGDEILVNEVPAVWNQNIASARVVLMEETDAE